MTPAMTPADEKAVAEIVPCNFGGNPATCSCGRCFLYPALLNLAARIRAEASGEVAALRKALGQADEAIMLALDMPGVSWCSPQRNAMEHARIAIDAALKEKP